MNAVVEIEQLEKGIETSQILKPKRQRIRKQKQYELIRVVKPS